MHNKCGLAKKPSNYGTCVTCRGRESESIYIDELCPTQSHFSPRKRLAEYPVKLNIGSRWRKALRSLSAVEEKYISQSVLSSSHYVLWPTTECVLYKDRSSTIHCTNLHFHIRTQNDRFSMFEHHLILDGLIFSR